MADARANVQTAEDTYRQAHQAAVTAGWSSQALNEMGYAAPVTPRRVRTRSSAPAADTPAAAEPADITTHDSQVA